MLKSLGVVTSIIKLNKANLIAPQVSTISLIVYASINKHNFCKSDAAILFISDTTDSLFM